MRRKRFQKGSLQTRKHGCHRVWVAFWWEDGIRRCKMLGRQSQMTKAEAEAVLSAVLRATNSGVAHTTRAIYTFEQFTNDVYLPFCRRSWKESTAGTSEQIVKSHLIPEFGKTLLHALLRGELQDLLDRKALDLSSSVVSHLRWFLNGIFKLALSDGLVLSNPASELRIPRKCQPGRTMRPLTEEEVTKYLGVFDLREKLIARLAIFEGLRAGEILALRLQGTRRRHCPGGAARLQTGSKHSEKRKDPRRRDLRRYAQLDRGVGRCGGRPFTGWICLSVRDVEDSAVSRQSLATVHVSEAGERWARMGNVSGAQKNERQSVEEGGRRSKGSFRSEGPRTWSEYGGVYQLRPGTEAGSREQTRSRSASETTTSKSGSVSEPGLME